MIADLEAAPEGSVILLHGARAAVWAVLGVKLSRLSGGGEGTGCCLIG